MNQQNQNQAAPTQAFWQLDKAKAAKVGQSSYISANTAEVYQIISAAWKANQRQDGSSTLYLSLHIMNVDKSTAHIDVYYGDTNGERYSGENIINATMLCANVPALSQVQGNYFEYNFDEKKDVTATGLIAPELAGKKIGMFLSDNFYFNQKQGQVKRGGLNLFNVFDASTRQLPHEKANNQPANPDTFEDVITAMLKSSLKSKEKADDAAGISAPPVNQFNSQAGNNAPAQSQADSGVSYQRGAANQPNSGMAPSNNYPPLDDGSDIPF